MIWTFCDRDNTLTILELICKLENALPNFTHLIKMKHVLWNKLACLSWSPCQHLSNLQLVFVFSSAHHLCFAWRRSYSTCLEFLSMNSWWPLQSQTQLTLILVCNGWGGGICHWFLPTGDIHSNCWYGVVWKCLICCVQATITKPKFNRDNFVFYCVSALVFLAELGPEGLALNL